MPTPSQHAFSEKVALITDGTNPVGRAVAMQLALYGCYVIVGHRETSEEETRALEELKSIGTLANSVEADLSTVSGANKIVSEVESLFGRLDLLVNCGNFRPDSTFETTDEDIFTTTIDSNLKSAFFVTQEALKLMTPRPKPKIVNILSACDSGQAETDILFTMTNQALAGFTKSLATTLPKKFRTNAVMISEKEVSISKINQLDEELFRVKSGIESDDVARAVIYLLSSEAIGVNGQILKVE